MATQRPTLFQQAQKEIRRLERATKRAIKRGYVFNLPFGRTKTGTQKTRYSAKEVERLRQLHLKDLYKYSKFGNEKYGFISGEEYRQQEKRWQAQQAAAKRWEYERTRRRKKEEYERRQLLDEIYSYKSISRTIIDNCMDRKNWRYTDKFYERFDELVKRRMTETSIDDVANVFQKMLNEGVLSQIQRHYKPEDFYVDIVVFQEYFDDIMPTDEGEEIFEEETEEFEDYEGDDFEEIFS